MNRFFNWIRKKQSARKKHLGQALLSFTGVIIRSLTRHLFIVCSNIPLIMVDLQRVRSKQLRISIRNLTSKHTSRRPTWHHTPPCHLHAYVVCVPMKRADLCTRGVSGNMRQMMYTSIVQAVRLTTCTATCVLIIFCVYSK